jgi:methyltransferase (TIGR00027 family)
VSEALISHVSDTARWVAVYRAMESERPDAIFRDPFARRLAGDEGESIVRAMPSGRAQAWAMIVRTKVFDEVITRLIGEQKVDAVLNLAAGLDARAYRLMLPQHLRWYDVDFPDMIAYRTKELAAATPTCRYEAIGVDLTDAPVRSRLFERIDKECQRVLVVAEGLLLYLTADDVAGLARDLAARPAFAYWLIDIANPLLLKMMNRTWGRRLQAGTAKFQFAPESGPAFFEPFGWRATDYYSNWVEARRLKRRMRGAWLWDIVMRLTPPATRTRYRTMAGSVLLERSTVAAQTP